jgi:ribosylpyrimidine nucleosidase
MEVKMKKQKVFLDCDPGHDDAINIMLAHAYPELELVGISVVAGNQTIEKTTVNALNVCQYLGIMDVPVAAGCGNAMVKPREICPEIHGTTGIDGPTFEPLVKKADPRHGVQLMIDTLMAAEDHEIMVVPTGPLTNVAMALRMEPRIIPKIKRIVLMGGSYQNGNVTPAAEFNIHCDPEAAYVVFTSGVPITMVGLDVTRKVLCYPEIVDRMAKIDNKASHLFVDLMRFFNKTQKEVFGWEGGPTHDPVTCASIIDPELLTTRFCHVSVDIKSEESYGRTNADIFEFFRRGEPNCDVAVDINVERFWDIIEQGIRYYGDK